MPDSTTPGQRFTQLIQQLGLTKNAFAQSLGKTATVIQHIVDERNKPGYDLLNRVCETYPNVSVEWLLRGLGPMLREPGPPPAVAAPTSAPATGGIDLREVPNAPRRRPGNLLQPADIAATLVLATQAPSANGHAAPATAAKPAPVPLAADATATVRAAAPTPDVGPPAAAEPAPATAPPQPAGPALAPVAPSVTSATTLPDPAYLAAALQTQHLQHQLALAEQRNQHLLEQQTLLRQMVELLKA